MKTPLYKKILRILLPLLFFPFAFGITNGGDNSNITEYMPGAGNFINGFLFGAVFNIYLVIAFAIFLFVFHVYSRGDSDDYPGGADSRL